jgi:hypothetical protein
MVNWILIALVVLIIAIIFIKFEHHAKRIKLIVLVLFLAFLYISASSVVHKNDIKLNSIQGWGQAVTLYFSWLGNAATNIWNAGGEVKSTVGNAIKSNTSEADDWKINIRR